tara:strand:+ start:338 stop:604 length:267 start_codon:yes stop_codon:yes gene_type:complete
MVDYRDFAIELTEEMGFSTEQMLVAALKWMSQDDVKGMLEANEYPMSCEEDEDLQARDEEMQEDLLARYPNAIAELEVLKKDFLGMAN